MEGTFALDPHPTRISIPEGACHTPPPQLPATIKINQSLLNKEAVIYLKLTNLTNLCLFLFFSMLLLCSFFKLKGLFQVKNGSTMSLPFFF